MALDPWYKIVTLRTEVREGRSFSPDEFAIALEQIVAQTAPVAYRDPAQFFSRTCFTRALKEHAGMVLRRLSGKTENTAPVLALVTQFGGGKTHTLASLYHIANAGADAAKLPGVADLLNDAGIAQTPPARVGVFVGNAWDPAEGRETPWIDLARQLAGDKGVAALGNAAKTTPPGTGALANVFAAADAPVLLLFDEVLNFVNRHRPMAEPFHAFLQNLTVAVTGTTQAAAVISLPRSQVEMTDWDQQWQDRITKVGRRVARDLIANDEVAHLPELRFALGEPDVDTTTIDNAATALEGSGFFIRKVGTDGYRIHHQATLRKVVSDRRASLDEATEIKPAIRKLVEEQFKRGATLPITFFPPDSTTVQDSPRLTLIVLDLGAGHASSSETLCGRIINALKSAALLNENVGAGYIDRHWPSAFKDTGAWPLTSLRQSFLNGALTRLLDPDAVLRQKVVEFVAKGDFGLASGVQDDGGFNRLWYEESVEAAEVAFEENVFLVTKAKAKALKAAPEHAPQPPPEPAPSPEPAPQPVPESGPAPSPANQKTRLRLTGTVPPEVWNRLETKLLPKLRSGEALSVGIEFTVSVHAQFVQNMEAELRQVLDDLELKDQVQVERSHSN